MERDAINWQRKWFVFRLWLLMISNDVDHRPLLLYMCEYLFSWHIWNRFLKKDVKYWYSPSYLLFFPFCQVVRMYTIMVGLLQLPRKKKKIIFFFWFLYYINPFDQRDRYYVFLYKRAEKCISSLLQWTMSAYKRYDSLPRCLDPSDALTQQVFIIHASINHRANWIVAAPLTLYSLCKKKKKKMNGIAHCDLSRRVSVLSPAVS